MQIKSNDFVSLADIGIANKTQQAAVDYGTTKAYNKRLAAMYEDGEAHGEALRAQSAEIKRRALRKLPELLEQAEANMQANGITVLWAADATEARAHVLDVAKKHEVGKVVKSKSMLSEEIALNDAMIEAGLDVVETDLGEWILQLNDEAPSHIIAPVIHKDKPSIVEIFRKVGYDGDTDEQTMAAFARKSLREAFLKADMGVSGGNFIVAETGTIGLVMNEGNGRMTTSLPNVHVAVVGIEKVVETLDDYTTLTQMISRAGTGQKLTVYTHMINGPRRENEEDGPEHVYVVLVDNGRSDIFGTDYAEALACIRCGACQNACPVYQSTGGHAYGWVYGGPIGAVVTPLLTGIENASPLPFASSLCGACKTACPVDIDIPRMLLDLRRDLVENGHSETVYDVGIKLWGVGMSNPLFYGLGGRAAKIGQKLTGNNLPPPVSNWQHHRDFPEFAPKPFREVWKERAQNGKGNNGDQA
ncbi:MAG: LutB/LldF family L-lactate oxidation iron-sulfur protein [Chloroflexota bacterium]